MLISNTFFLQNVHLTYPNIWKYWWKLAKNEQLVITWSFSIIKPKNLRNLIQKCVPGPWTFFKKSALDLNIKHFIMKYHIMLWQFMATDTNYEYANSNFSQTLAQKIPPKFFLAYFFSSLRLSFSNRASLISF